MRIEWLQGFSVFAEDLNFTRAAARQNISQPAFFRQIQSLSEALGVQLYVKDGRNLRLTQSGTQVALFARDIVERVQEFQRSFTHGDHDGDIVVAAGQGTYLYLLGNALRESKTVGKLKLLTTAREETLTAIRSGRAHLGITVLDSPPLDLASELLLRMKPILAVPDDHELAGRKRIHVSHLDQIPLVVPPSPSALRDLLRQRLHSEGAELQVALEATGWELMLHFVQLGFGAAVVNGCCRLPRGVQAVPIVDLPTTDYYLLHRREQYFFPALNSLRARIIRKIKEAGSHVP